tara:strand:+ start:164 stop:601 length:438 start_codon:yes stop_codon:yes gene_type:complete
MNLDDIKKMVEKDSVVDQTLLDQEALKTPQLHSKYLNLLNDEILIFKKLETEYKRLYRLKWEYYTGKMDKEELERMGWQPFQHKILRQDVGIYMESDKELCLVRDRKSFSETKIKYLEDVIKSINNRNWNIRNAIEWRKFMHGGH